MLVLELASMSFVQRHYILANPQIVNAVVLAWDREVGFVDLQIVELAGWPMHVGSTTLQMYRSWNHNIAGNLN
jgi:hypothetical protein